MTIKTKTGQKTTLTLTLKNTICPHNVQSCAKPISSRPQCQRAVGQSPDARPRERASASVVIALYFINEEAHAQHTHPNNI